MWIGPQFWMADCSTNGLKEIKTLIQHFTDLCKLQVLMNEKYALNGAHFKQQSKHRSYTWNTKKYGRKSLCTDLENCQISVC